LIIFHLYGKNFLKSKYILIIYIKIIKINKNYLKSNYVTFFNEDWRNSMFNNDKFGFRNSPTDFYLKPYWLAVYDSLSSMPNKANSNKVPCFYDKLYHMLSFNWLTMFLKEYSPSKNLSKVDQNLFGIVKVNEMSHDYLERLFWIDDDLLQLFKDIFTESFLDNTLFIVMGKYIKLKFIIIIIPFELCYIKTVK